MSSVASIHKRHAYDKDAHMYYPVVVIGAGESGVAMGCRLKEALGFDQFRIFERQSGIGGTWWINRYPGVACDIPAIFYSFSFAPKKNWTTLHPPGREIAQYLADVCEKYQIVDKIQFNTDVTEIRWIQEDEEWEVTLSHMVHGTGDMSKKDRDALIAQEGKRSVFVEMEVVRAKVVVSGVGGLVEPNTWPQDIPGIDSFQGEVMHTARWDKNVDLKGKNVVVVGSGCSAAQVVPELPGLGVKSAVQLMRTPPWVQPNLMEEGQLRWWEKWSPTLMTNVPGLAHTARSLLFFRLEWDFLRLFKNSSISSRHRPSTEQLFLRHMRRLAPEKYHEILTPNYSLGCKRRIIDTDWYVSLQSPSIDLTTEKLSEVRPNSVVVGPGRHYPPGKGSKGDKPREIPADVIVMANGYETNKWLHPLRVIGRDGKALEDVWEERGGAQAYLGIAVDHFPNFFMLFGPNTATGHTSVIFATENAANYSLNFMKPILNGHVSTYEITEEAEKGWTDKLQKGLQDTVFRKGTCSSWYSTEGGWNASTYP